MRDLKIITACPICGNVDSKYLYKYKGKSGLFSAMKIYSCIKCSLVFASPMPEQIQLDNYYNCEWLNNGLISTSPDAEMTYKIQAVERVKYLLKHIVLPSKAKVLDIGSGYGCLYDAFVEADKSVEFYSVEPNPGNVKRLEAKGLKVFKNIADINTNDFDIVTLCFVLEHVPSPKTFLESAIKKVKTGGYLFIDVPDRDDEFKPIHEPHLCFFDKCSLKNLIDGLNCKIIDIIGYGRKKSELLKGRPIFRKIADKLRLFAKFSKIDEKDLYREFAFDSEGEDRWWFRAIIKKN